MQPHTWRTPRHQGCKNTERQVARSTKFAKVATNICGPSVCNLLHVTHLAPGIFRWHLDLFFLNCCTSGVDSWQKDRSTKVLRAPTEVTHCMYYKLNFWTTGFMTWNSFWRITVNITSEARVSVMRIMLSGSRASLPTRVSSDERSHVP